EANGQLLESEIKEDYESISTIKKKIIGKKKTDFFIVADQYLDNLLKSEKYKQYNTQKNRIKKFKSFVGKQDLAFREVSVVLLRKFETCLLHEDKKAPRTVVNYLMVIRTVYNRAISDSQASKDLYPFGKGKIQIKFPQSEKIGLGIDEVKLLENSKELSPPQQHAVNLWLATVGFNVPMLQREKRQLLRELNGRNKIIFYLYVGGGVILCITLYVFYRNHKIKSRLNLLMSTNIEPINSNRDEKDELQISSEIIVKIKEGLVLFETENGFLDPGITQELLAKRLRTNSSYLSMIINNEKGINFSTYLKDLRVTYAINFLKANPEIATKYTMKGMSELFGFKSADSFSRALSSKIGVSASNYLRRIKKESYNL